MPNEEGLLLLLDFLYTYARKFHFFSIFHLLLLPPFFSSSFSSLYIYFYKKFISVFTINFFIFTRHDYIFVCVWVRMWKLNIYIYIHTPTHWYINYIICIIIIRFFSSFFIFKENFRFFFVFFLFFHFLINLYLLCLMDASFNFSLCFSFLFFR